MTKLAIIGGTGLTRMQGLEIIAQKDIETPFGTPSASYSVGRFNELEILFLPRHGNPPTIPPHRINYRANMWGLKELGAEQIIAVAAVGGITEEMAPGHIVIPSQIIDYTYGRENTFFEHDLQQITHIDFTNPYSHKLRSKLIEAATGAALPFSNGGVYGCTQGPRLESVAEIIRMQRDGCDLVGMTGMPEAALARELELDYAACAVVANWAAGKTDGEITMHEIEKNLHAGMAKVTKLISHLSQL